MGSYPQVHETLLFLIPGPCSLSKMSSLSSQEKWKQSSGEPKESTGSSSGTFFCLFPTVVALALTAGSRWGG